MHQVSRCQGCGAELGQLEAEAHDRRQVFDLPPVKLQVTEHRAEIKCCPVCARRNQGVFPDGISHEVQYGAGIKGLFVYLMNEHLLPYRRTRQIVEDMLGQSVAEGTLWAALNECAQALAGTEAIIKQGGSQSPVAHFDETGLYVEGRRGWLHVASTESLTHYACHGKRGSVATDEIGILPDFRGTAVHDGWGSYRRYDCAHALCNAHHLRELTFVQEQLGQAWAGQMKALLVEIKGVVDKAKASGQARLEPARIQAFEQRYEQILAPGVGLETAAPPEPSAKRGRPRQSKAKNLLDRLRRYRQETLAFLYDFQVPFDNNLAERDLRMMKVQQKISGCFRTVEGATTFCRIRSYISTMRKQGHHIFTALNRVFTGQPIAPALTG
jgi:transposase